MIDQTRKPTGYDPGEDLLNAIKAGFVRQGTSYSRWCRENNVERTAARLAILGGWRGPKARKLIARITKAANVESQQVAA